jgi:hypothetical protein
LKHLASRRFWAEYDRLPVHVRNLADKSFELLKADPKHPSLHFKKIGVLWSVRVGAHHRALGVEVSDGILWLWIGSHASYDQKLP